MVSLLQPVDGIHGKQIVQECMCMGGNQQRVSQSALN